MTSQLASVAVLGGGIAGAAACLRLVQSGIFPLWVAPDDARTFKPGEHLSAAAQPLLKEIGSNALLRSAMHRQAYGTYSAWGSDHLTERNAIVQLEGPPNVLDRLAFETALGEQAVAEGANRVESAATNLKILDGCWHFEADGRSFQSEFLFDATGRKAVVASKFTTRFQADQLASVYGVWEQHPASKQARPVTLIEAVADGWWYLSLFADQRVVVNYFSDADLLPSALTKAPAAYEKAAAELQFIGSFLHDYGYRLKSKPQRMTTNTTWLAPVVGAGWAAIGDAAAAFDPLSSHGMTTALWSAINAADAFIARDGEAMNAYSSNVTKGVQDFLIARQQIYAQETRFPDSQFWSRRTNPKTFDLPVK